MNEIPYKWYVSYDEESYSYCFNTRQEAIDFANEEYEIGDRAFVIEARLNQIKLSSRIDMNRILEDAEESLEDVVGEDGVIFYINDDQFKSLQTAVEKAIDGWEKENELVFMEQIFFDIKTQFNFIVGEEYV